MKFAGLGEADLILRNNAHAVWIRPYAALRE